MAEVDISITGRQYRVACRAGEEENLRRAADLIDSRSREALAGLGSMSESRQLLYAALLIADEILEKGAPQPQPTPLPAPVSDAVLARAEVLAARLESLADALENGAATS